MNEEQQYQEGAQEEKRSSLARLLLGKVVGHRIFSDRVLFWIVLGISFLLPIFFVPGQFATPEFAKILLLEVGVLFGVFAWAMGRLRDGHVETPKSLLLLISFLLVLQFVISALFSPSPLISFLGTGYDIGSASIFVVLFLLMFLASLVFRDRDRVLMLFASFLLTGLIAMLYHLSRHLFGADLLDFGIFTSPVATPIGKWNDLAAIVGGVLVLTLSTLYFFPDNKSLRLPAGLILALGLFFLLIIDFTILWFILLVVVGFLTVLSVYEGERAHRRAIAEAEASGAEHPRHPVHRRVIRHLPVFASILLVVCAVYASGLAALPWGSERATIAGVIARTLNASPYSEVVLTPKTTFEIVSATLQDSPVFGSGPNRFGSSFLLHKSSEMNLTPFWDSAFEYGVGRIPTYFGTTGVIGMLLWIIFIAVLLMKSKKIFRLFEQDRIASYLAFTLFLMTIYLWGLAFFYLPNIAIFSLAFIFTGALVAFLVHERVLGVHTVSFGNSRLSVVVTPVLIVVLAGITASGVLLYRQVSSLVSFREAQLALNSGDLDTAETAISRAVGFSSHDIYYRTMSNIALVRLSRLASATDIPQEELAEQVKNRINDAQVYARRAIEIDPENFENHLQLGGVFDTLGALGIQDTGEAARASYEQALRLNPKSPRILFVLGRLEYVSGDQAKAKEYLTRALLERPNYLEAISFVVQLDLQEGKTEDAIAVLSAGVAAEPTNFLLRFALGYLYYSNANYNSAIPEFEAAVMLNPVYSDAKYFLGLSYAQLGRRDDAILQFTDVQTLNPDNTEVTKILGNLKAGRDPFSPSLSAPTTPIEDALEDLDRGEGGAEE